MSAPILVGIGTRPEAIKLAPVVAALRSLGIPTVVVSTGQHKELLEDVLEDLELVIDLSLEIEPGPRRLSSLLGDVTRSMQEIIDDLFPSIVVVHGDTATTLASATAAFLNAVPVAHVEAGLRSGRLDAPWPEEGFRRMIDGIASLHFAPTDRALQNLRREGFTDSSIVTGNTVVDSVLGISKAIDSCAGWEQDLAQRFSLDLDRPTILATMHRREALGAPMARVLEGLAVLGARGNQIVFPLHRNPSVRAQIRAALEGETNVRLMESLGYRDFVALLKLSSLVVTDSGGLQEEAPVLGRRCLVVRDVTERPEGVEVGAAEVVGYQTERLVKRAMEVLGGHCGPLSAEAHAIYGDGSAGVEIARHLAKFVLK